MRSFFLGALLLLSSSSFGAGYITKAAGSIEGVGVLSSGIPDGYALLANGAGGADWVFLSGAGDVIGPASSVDGEIVLFSGLTGKLVKRLSGSGLVKVTSGVAAVAALVNADVDAAAAIAYSKLNLSSSILNADISASAAIARSKIATGTANRLVINANSTGALSEAGAITAARVLIADANGIPTHSGISSTTLGYLDATSSIQTQLDGKLPAAGNAATATALFTNPAACGAGQFVSDLAADGTLTCSVPSGGGDVAGPASSTDGQVALYNGTTGKLLKTGAVSNLQGGTGGDSSGATGLAKVAAGTWSYASLLNADVDASAAIAYSKLNLSGSILNADINSSAAIAYSKLNLGTSIVNADISGSAAIAYSKLNLGTSIVNADVSNSAAIAYSKLNLGTSIVNADISGSAAIAYSKLNLGTSILNADIATAAAIDYSKLAALTAGNIVLGSPANVATSTAVTGDVTITSSGVTAIGSGVIVNADVSGSAAIDYSKLATLTAGNVVLGNASNVAASTALSGDVTVNSSGVTAIGSGVIVNADVSGSAAIALSKISLTGMVEDLHGLIATVADATYVLIQKNRVARQVTKIALDCGTSGSVTAKLQIDGVDITTCTGISVTTTESDTTCDTGATNNLPADATLSLVTSSNSACLNLAWSIETTRD